MDNTIKTKSIYVYVGTYTHPIKFGTGQIFEGKGKGIYRLSLNTYTGELTQEGTVTEAINPSYLTLDQTKKFLYSVNELKEYNGEVSGSISAYKINSETREPIYINTKATRGTDPCHVVVNNENTHVFVTNFMSGSVSAFPIEKDGSLGDASDFVQHIGSSINKTRQTSPHAHSLIFDANNRFAFVPDLGIDKVMIYKPDFVNGTLIPNDTPYFEATLGAGPRHCVFHNSYKYCYLINELNSTISALSYNAEKGVLKELQIVPSVVEDFSGENTCADVHITPNGRFLYGSNRGHNSIVIYEIDQESGLLKYVGTSQCGGKTPRNFGIDPTGTFVLVCNQDTDNIVVFKIDENTGELTKVFDYHVPTPVCVKLYIF
ncbi:MAG: 6-phosphogluconolactonase [Firmicutes bacterium HGW-Firmicutes-7]|nr:MAG: 6-phosphogluconolactonase [Firmicutes bacterium HGW-Firmicutes-7]